MRAVYTTVAIFMLIACGSVLSAGDSSCRQIQGLCRYTYEGCDGHFLRGQCSGPSSRQCCLPYDNSECTSTGGRCQYTSTPCTGGTYVKGKCGGPYNRKCCVQNPGSPSTGKYDADIMKLSPTGCKASTCRQDRLSYTGVRASSKMLDNDYDSIESKKSCYVSAGNKYRIHAAVIAAIASRESRAGRVLRRNPSTGTDGWGDCSSRDCRAYGVMQCDVYSTGLGRRHCTQFGHDSCEHIEMMTRDILVKEMLKCVKNKFPSWPPERQLQGAVAAYNFGCSNVWSWGGLDQGSTGDDYSNDVMARAQRLITGHDW